MVRLMAGLRVVVGPPGYGGSWHIGNLDDLGVGNDSAASCAVTVGEVEDGTGGVEAGAPEERSGRDGHLKCPVVKRWPRG